MFESKTFDGEICFESVIEIFFRLGFELTDLQKNFMWTGFKKRQKYAVFESLENLKNGNYYSL